jgi:hypothetical protein
MLSREMLFEWAGGTLLYHPRGTNAEIRTVEWCEWRIETRIRPARSRSSGRLTDFIAAVSANRPIQMIGSEMGWFF